MLISPVMQDLWDTLVCDVKVYTAKNDSKIQDLEYSQIYLAFTVNQI